MCRPAWGLGEVDWRSKEPRVDTARCQSLVWQAGGAQPVPVPSQQLERVMEVAQAQVDCLALRGQALELQLDAQLGAVLGERAAVVNRDGQSGGMHEEIANAVVDGLRNRGRVLDRDGQRAEQADVPVLCKA